MDCENSFVICSDDDAFPIVILRIIAQMLSLLPLVDGDQSIQLQCCLDGGERFHGRCNAFQNILDSNLPVSSIEVISLAASGT